MSHQVVPAWWGEADIVELGDVAGQTALLQVVHRPLALGMLAQLLAIVGGRALQYRVQRAVLARGARAPPVTPFLPWNLHAGLACQFLHRLGKVQALEVHQEADGIAAGAAAEAVVELLVRADTERGGLLVVEGAEGRIVL